jgi:hypothetical protein
VFALNKKLEICSFLVENSVQLWFVFILPVHYWASVVFLQSILFFWRYFLLFNLFYNQIFPQTNGSCFYIWTISIYFISLRQIEALIWAQMIYILKNFVSGSLGLSLKLIKKNILVEYRGTWISRANQSGLALIFICITVFIVISNISFLSAIFALICQ